jgi:hypothetical protein
MNNSRKVRQFNQSPLSHKQLKAAKKAFAKKPNSTRAFTSSDYAALPVGEPNATV